MTPAKLRLAQAAVGKRGTVVADLCEELGISSQTLTGTSPSMGGLRIEGKEIISRRNF
jgi:hypothetical protein